MPRRALSVAVLVLSLALAAAPSRAQSIFPPTAWAAESVLAAASGVGANGEIVDPYILTQAVNSGGCLVAFVPLSVITTRCADDDGCVLRLVSDTDSGRVGAAPRTFVTAANGLAWTVSFTTSVSGLNGNMTVTEILEVDSNACTMWDDFQSSNADYELRACNNVSCTLRIDD